MTDIFRFASTEDKPWREEEEGGFRLDSKERIVELARAGGSPGSVEPSTYSG